MRGRRCKRQRIPEVEPCGRCRAALREACRNYLGEKKQPCVYDDYCPRCQAQREQCRCGGPHWRCRCHAWRADLCPWSKQLLFRFVADQAALADGTPGR